MTVVENNVNTGNAATAADVADERPVVLKVDHVAKSFRLPTEQASGLKMAFLNWTKGIGNSQLGKTIMTLQNL